jgi:cytochrome P450
MPEPAPHLRAWDPLLPGCAAARLEAKIALTIMLDRYRDITVATDAPVEYRNPWLMASVNKLPLDVRAA